MTRSLWFAIAALALAGQAKADDRVDFKPVPNGLQLPKSLKLGPCSAVDTDSKGRLYLFHRGKQPILCFDRDGKFLRSWGDKLIGKAHGLRVDRDDNVWVTDIGHHMVYKFNPRGKLQLSLGKLDRRGPGTDQFNQPTDVAFGPKGEIYVADGYGNSRVMKFAANGKFLATWGKRGKGRGEFHLPHAILVDGKGRVIVGDRENNRIQVFDANGKLLDVWPGFAPYGMAFDRQGRLFVADGRANAVLQLNSKGKVVGKWGRKGTGPGEFHLPHMLAADAAGNLYIAEVGNRRLQKLQRRRVQRGKHGDGSVRISGEPRQWHKLTLTLDGPFADERDDDPNPFVDLRMTVTFTHESGTPKYVVPGYFAADGNAANTSATSGTKWRAHLSPDKTGKWTYRVAFERGKQPAVGSSVPDAASVRDASRLKPYHGKTGTFTIKPTDKSGRDLRGEGRLQYVGKHYLRFAGSKRYFLKAGPDAPETLLAYRDFDGTTTKKTPLKTWQPHVRDWKPGDPTWKADNGKGLIGALNYLSAKGCNAFSFLTYNAGGDGDNVWPFVSRDDKLHYDCSKLDQWQIVFDHAQTRGLYLHFKMQEQENDDNFLGGKTRRVAVALDGGDLGVERKLYCRELIARFGHCLALNWNLGEENTQSPAQQRAMAKYIRDTDPYKHHIVVHTYPNRQDAIYSKLLGKQSVLTGASLQNPWNAAHRRTLHWVRASAKAGKPWVVANDEQNPASLGVPPDPGFAGHDGKARDKQTVYDLHDIRKATLWGTLLAGGAGVEYYFGYTLPQNDLLCENFRSRDQSWNYGRIALDFFREQKIPFHEMRTDNALVGNATNDNSRYCFAKPGAVYVVYLPNGGTTRLDLTKASGTFTVGWFNPRRGGKLLGVPQKTVAGGGKVKLGPPPEDAMEDWVVVVVRRRNGAR